MTDQELWSLSSCTPILVVAKDYSYTGYIVTVFKKIGGAQRCVVEDDNGRLFIHNASQLSLIEDLR